MSSRVIALVRAARCIFEHVYFARPDSAIGRNVAETRKQFGRELAREDSVEADIVVPVPDSGLLRAVDETKGANSSYCTACFTLEYPIVTRETEAATAAV